MKSSEVLNIVNLPEQVDFSPPIFTNPGLADENGEPLRTQFAVFVGKKEDVPRFGAKVVQEIWEMQLREGGSSESGARAPPPRAGIAYNGVEFVRLVESAAIERCNEYQCKIRDTVDELQFRDWRNFKEAKRISSWPMHYLKGTSTAKNAEFNQTGNLRRQIR